METRSISLKSITMITYHKLQLHMVDHTSNQHLSDSFQTKTQDPQLFEYETIYRVVSHVTNTITICITTRKC